MKIAALRCFCALVDTRSFHAAAQSVHRTQPAVTQQVQALEQELGQRLWDRTVGATTEAGAALYPRAKDILLRVDSLPNEIAELADQPPRELRIGTSDTNALYLLPPVIARFRRRWPETHLEVFSRSSVAVEQAVAARELDLGIVTLPAGNEELAAIPLFETTVRLIAPKDSPLAANKNVSLHDLRDTPLVLLEATTKTGRTLRESFRAANIDPPIVLDSGSFEVIKRYVAEGLGASLVPALAVEKRDTRRLASIPVTDLPPVHYGAVRRRDAPAMRAVDSFLEFLRAECAKF